MLQRDEPALVDLASTPRLESFAQAVSYWEQRADPDGADRSDQERQARRDAYLVSSIDGIRLGQVILDPISGSIVGDELARLDPALFESDWAAARALLGREPMVSELPRAPGQRRADALVEMATRSRSVAPDGRRPRPLSSVYVDYETLTLRIRELASGSVVAPGSLVWWLETADFERAAFGPGPRVELGASTRLFTGATRRAIELRDRACTHPFCDRPARECEAEHLVPHCEGGLSIQENGRLLCGFHNRLHDQRPPPRR